MPIGNLHQMKKCPLILHSLLYAVLIAACGILVYYRFLTKTDLDEIIERDRRDESSLSDEQIETIL